MGVVDKSLMLQSVKKPCEKQKSVYRKPSNALKRNTARKLIARIEMDDQLIAEITELPVEEVRAETQH
ncbi:hypothetical protein CWI66_17000 [Halomonas sp. 141]|uniref:hypothetical protein n=1 Tax=unclassified Halomonas TaxID=2609666 RepID=UPI0009BD97B4|nr:MULTISPECIES: hypothetical protein [unclassified Halomonas]PJX12567.1 hypothetical protein CWI66_17000 [Halomonas sp. 141]